MVAQRPVGLVQRGVRAGAGGRNARSRRGAAAFDLDDTRQRAASGELFVLQARPVTTVEELLAWMEQHSASEPLLTQKLPEDAEQHPRALGIGASAARRAVSRSAGSLVKRSKVWKAAMARSWRAARSHSSVRDQAAAPRESPRPPLRVGRLTRSA